MRKILYLLPEGPNDRPSNLLPVDQAPDAEVSVILIQDGVTLRDVPARYVYALADDASDRHVTPAFPTVSYQEMLQMMFDADSVVAL